MTSISTLARATATAVVFAFAVLFSTQQASANADAETFVQGLVDKGVAILRDNGAGDNARRAKFRDFITQYADVEKTALFTLGNYRRGAADADLQAFVNAFKDYATAVYESRLDQYKGQSLKVVGSIDNKPGDCTVNTVVQPVEREPIRVGFRLLGGNGNYRFVDVQVAGIWLSVDQRDQFAAFLGQNNGNIPKLTGHLVSQTAQINAAVDAKTARN